MDADSWSSHFSSVSKKFPPAFQSRSDVFMGFEEIDGAIDDIREEFPCPFCAEYFDIVGLCCHIDDEHPIEAKNGLCPICAMRVGVDMVAHITSQHGDIFKVQRKRKSRKNGSTLSFLRRELREGNLHSLFGNSSCVVSSSNVAPDPLLSSFILPDEFLSSQPPQSSADVIFVNEGQEKEKLERNRPTPPLSIKDREERTMRSEFVQSLFLSAIVDDNL